MQVSNWLMHARLVSPTSCEILEGYNHHPSFSFSLSLAKSRQTPSKGDLGRVVLADTSSSFKVQVEYPLLSEVFPGIPSEA